jgi:Eukaryotic aspartyl protease
MGWRLSKGVIGYPDTGTSFLIMPQAVYEKIMPVIIAGNQYDTDSDGYYYVYCDGKFNSLYLLMGDTWFEIPPSVYLFKIPNYTQFCYIGMGHVSSTYWLLGDTFLRSYYSVWDSPGNQIGFAPHKTSVASTISLADLALPPTAFSPGNEVVGIILEVFSILMLGGFAAGTIVYVVYSIL